MIKSKFTSLLVLIVLFTATLSAQNVKDAVNMLNSGQGNVAYEKIIKFEFQEHMDAPTVYNIKFLQSASGLEFWAHGKEYLSIFSPEYLVHLTKSEALDFYAKINQVYTHFDKIIRIRFQFNEHVDMNMTDNIILSCTLGSKPDDVNFAFWVNQEKYSILEKDLIKLLALIRSYYQ